MPGMRIEAWGLTNWIVGEVDFDILEAEIMGLCSLVLQTSIFCMVWGADQLFEVVHCLKK